MGLEKDGILLVIDNRGERKTVKLETGEHPIDARLRSLRKMDKKDLQNLAKQYHKVIDVHDIPKIVLISDILEVEFGRKKLEEWNRSRR